MCAGVIYPPIFLYTTLPILLKRERMSYIILDRDGVINYDSEAYIKSPDEWIPIPHSLKAIADLNRAGFKVIVATNQSGVARGYYDLETLDKIHHKFKIALASEGGEIQDIFFCPHHPDEGCLCRKPKPGMLQDIQKKYALNLAKTFFIGDSFSDVQAAQAAGCKPLLVLTGKGQLALAKNPEVATIARFADLAAAVQYVLAQANHD
jgi:D-glycero-D-manno-heptose 1,7-bisphosphate phosphatase